MTGRSFPKRVGERREVLITVRFKPSEYLVVVSAAKQAGLRPRSEADLIRLIVNDWLEANKPASLLPDVPQNWIEEATAERVLTKAEFRTTQTGKPKSKEAMERYYKDSLPDDWEELLKKAEDEKP